MKRDVIHIYIPAALIRYKCNARHIVQVRYLYSNTDGRTCLWIYIKIDIINKRARRIKFY